MLLLDDAYYAMTLNYRVIQRYEIVIFLQM